MFYLIGSMSERKMVLDLIKERKISLFKFIRWVEFKNWKKRERLLYSGIKYSVIWKGWIFFMYVDSIFFFFL